MDSQAYEMSVYEHEAVDLVKSLLTRNYYRDLFAVDNHLLHLDSIRQKLSVLSAAEQHNGLINWGLRNQISDINSVMSRLRTVRQKLFSAL